MKRYVNQMNRTDVPEDLNEKLRNLKTPRKPVAVYRWVAAAAAFALVLGGGLLWRGSRPEEPMSMQAVGTGVPELGKPEVGQPDIATKYNGEETGETSGFSGGYEVDDGEITSYFMLPALNFQPAAGQTAMNYILGDTCREATKEEVAAALGKNWRANLGIPESAEVVPDVFFDKDGKVCGFSLSAWWGEKSVYIEMVAGHNVPNCCTPVGDGGHTDVRGVDVVTLVWDSIITDGVTVPGCEAQFFKDNTGWKATIMGENYGELTARFVRLGVMDTGIGLAALGAYVDK